MIIKASVLVNISIKSTTFSFNRGVTDASGTGVRIYIKSINPRIKLTGLQFWNNSVIKFYDNSSALTVFYMNFNEYSTKTLINNFHARQSSLNMSLCILYGNHGGRNMVSYVVAGEPSQVLANNCTIMNNWDYIWCCSCRVKYPVKNFTYCF